MIAAQKISAIDIKITIWRQIEKNIRKSLFFAKFMYF